jgi:type I restriction enzyme M protein
LLFDALGFDPTHAFLAQPSKEHELFPSPSMGEGQGEGVYLDFAPALADRSMIRTLVESDAGVQARARALRDALNAWWTAHAPRLADLPKHHELNRVRAEFLNTFGAALLPLGTLDRFKLAGVIATWWTDTLPDFKTLLENGFPGVVDGWVDTIADAVEDDEAAGPAFDPFGHTLVRRTMADYLERIAAAKADIARLKGEKEAFEQGNAPDDADEEELANWNYAKDLDRQMKELKAGYKDTFKEFAKLEKAATKARAAKNNPSSNHARTGALFPPSHGGRELEGGGPLYTAKTALQPVLDQLAAIEAALAPYEQIKTDLAAARARYRELTAAFVNELKSRCGVMNDDQKRAVVLELFAQDVQAGLDAAVAEKRQELVRFVEGLWDKYASPLAHITQQRDQVTTKLADVVKALGYVH